MKHERSTTYYVTEEAPFSFDYIAEFIAERVQKGMGVVFVSDNPEYIHDNFMDAWHRQTQSLIVERDHEHDIAYMAGLTDIIAIMQQSLIAYGDMTTEQAFSVVHPDELMSDLWDGKDIVVSCDATSTAACIDLMQAVHPGSRLLVLYGVDESSSDAVGDVEGLVPLSEGYRKQRQLLKKLKMMCTAEFGDLGDAATGASFDVHLLRAALLGSTEAYNDFTELHRRLVDMRVPCGRVSPHRDVSSEWIHTLKLVSTHVVPPTTNSNWLLFDSAGEDTEPAVATTQ